MPIAFYYPTKAAPTASWTPAKQPIYPLSESVDFPQQLTGKTAGGQIYIQEKGPPESSYELKYKRISKADRDNALVFFNAIKKAFYPFEYEDQNGSLIIVRWMNKFDFKMVLNDRYDAIINLRKEI